MNTTLITNSHGSSLHDATCPSLAHKLQAKDLISHTSLTKRHEIVWAITGTNVAIHSCVKDAQKLRRPA